MKIKIIFDSDALVAYLSLPIVKEISQIDLSNSFENRLNIFVLSKPRILFFDKIAKYNNLSDKWEKWLESVRNNEDSIYWVGEKEIDEKNIVAQNISLLNTIREQNDYSFIISTKDKNQYDECLPFTCFYCDVKKPNKDYILLGLMSGRAVTLRPADFLSFGELKTFFSLFFKLSYPLKSIDWFDDYCNENDIFDGLIGKGYYLHIYTMRFHNENENYIRKKFLKQKYGERRVFIKYCGDKTVTHPRRLMNGRFIIESNHDFASINNNNDNWKLDISYIHDALILKDFESIKAHFS